MAFIDRIVEYPGRIKLTDTGGVVLGTYDVERAEGTVTLDGTLLNATNLNDQTTNRYTPTFDLDTSAAPGTTDGDLYAAITALAWEGDVII